MILWLFFKESFSLSIFAPLLAAFSMDQVVQEENYHDMTIDISSFKENKPALHERFLQVAAHRQAGVQLIMEGVSNPSNLGAIARSCDAFGVQNVSFLPTKRYKKEKRMMQRSSVSATQWLDFQEFESTQEHFAQLKKEGWFIVSTSSEVEATSLYDIDFTQYEKVAIAVGSEGQGLSETALQGADMIATIPMYSVIRSLNVSVAAAIMLAEVSRQRQGKKFFLNDAEEEALVVQLIQRYFDKREKKGEKDVEVLPLVE